MRPQAIRDTALLTIEGELDDISGNGQTEAAHAAVPQHPARAARALRRRRASGHYGIFSGRRWREMIFPRVRDFIRDLQLVARAFVRPATARSTMARGRCGANSSMKS